MLFAKWTSVGAMCRYDFTDGDLSISCTQMHEYLDKYDAIPYQVLQFLFTEVNYGGRVTDDKDRRLINNLVLNFCNPGVVDAGYLFSPDGTFFSRCVCVCVCVCVLLLLLLSVFHVHIAFLQR